MKFFKRIILCSLLVLSVFGMASCTLPDSSEPVFEIAGSLQTLYGEGGYPQAVLVAKKSVIDGDPAAVAAMTSYMQGADGYLSGADPAAVVTDLAKAYADGLEPSFNAKNLTKEVIKNCSVKFTAAAAAKETVKTFLTKLLAVSETFTAQPADGFFYQGNSEAGTQTGKYTVFAPDGAPALALAYAVSETEGDAFTYHIVAAGTIPAQVSNQDEAKNADFCILPVNIAAKLLGTGERYEMLGVVTNGNMYFMRTRSDQSKINSKADLKSLVGCTVGVVQIDNVPGLTLRSLLDEAKVPYQIVDSDAKPAADKVNLIAFADAKTVGPGAGCDYYLCPEPAATAKATAFKNQNQ